MEPSVNAEMRHPLNTINNAPQQDSNMEEAEEEKEEVKIDED